MKRKILILGIIGMFLGMSLISSGANISTKENTVITSSSASGKAYWVVVRYNGERVQGADVEAWNGRNKDAGVYCEGTTDSIGVFWTASDGIYFDPESHVHIHAEKIIDGEKKVDTYYHTGTTESDHVRIILDLHEPKGESKEMSNPFDLPLFNRLSTMFPIFKNLEIFK